MPEATDPGPLVLPTDRNILKKIQDRDRYTPKLVGLLTDQDPSYCASQLRTFEAREYVKDPAIDYGITDERSGMYTLTDIGAIATFHINQYVRDHHDIFHAASRVLIDKQPADTFSPDLIAIDESERIALRKLDQVDGVTIPSELTFDLTHDAGYAPRTAGDALYALYYHGLAERVENMDVYRITDRGETAAELLDDGVTDPVELTDRLRETYTADEKERLDALTP